jgi:hypothetical protein
MQTEDLSGTATMKKAPGDPGPASHALAHGAELEKIDAMAVTRRVPTV